MACRFFLSGALVAAVCSSPVRGQDPDPDAPQTVTLRGQTFEVYPPELLRAKGMKAPDIPHDRNAAWVYVEAINAMIDMPAGVPRETIDAAASGSWPTGENAAKLATWLDQNQTALDQVRRASEMEAYHMPMFRGENS